MINARRLAVLSEAGFAIGTIVLVVAGLVLFLSRKLSLEVRFLVFVAVAALSIPAYVFLYMIFILAQFDGHSM